jgi:REP element-mobilizing transposase RayT
VHFVHTTRFRRGKLPHWEVEAGRYFVTVRLADSLPREVVLRLQEIHRSLSAIEPKTDQFAALQRTYFRTMEKYLDAGAGACWLKRADITEFIAREFAALNDWNVDVAHYTIMPNHWHALISPTATCEQSLSAVMKRIKGRTAKCIRHVIGGNGPVWQREWFDRWIRNDGEWTKTLDYIQQNPVKAGLVRRYEDHAWTR